MPNRYALLINLALLEVGLLSACSTTRQIVVDYPKTEASALPVLKGQSSVTTDDYYVQLVSEFEFKGDNALKAGCSDVGASYETGDTSAALLFDIHNETLKFKREASGFLYQATTGKCNYRLETKKAYLTPWVRLDSAKDTEVEYRFLTSNNREANLSQLVGDINAASGLMALTGVGTGIAVMGSLAGSWMESAVAKQPAVNSLPASAKYSSETHSLPNSVVFASNGGTLNQSRLAVYEVLDGGMKVWADGTKLLGEMRVYPELAASLLIKSSVDGIPDAHDLSLDELMRMPIQTAAGEMPLQQLIEGYQGDKPNMAPDWRDYQDVESQCRRMKLIMKGLGFNKFDRNAVLYYFLAQSPDWRNFNISPQRAMTDAIRPKALEQFRSKGFSHCLTSEDYQVMKTMKLAVNTDPAWDELNSNRQKKEGVISTVQSFGRQLLSALNQQDKDEMTKQLYPLLFDEKSGNGFVRLQNHLGNFGLENLLQIPQLADEGMTISAAQLADIVHGLMVESYSCVRPAQEYGQPMANIGILLFVTKKGSPREKGGALEFELARGKISRLSFQHPTFRDFEQNVADYPDLGGCRIDTELLNRLH